MSDELRAADEYEAEFMGSGDGVLHREKLSYPAWFLALAGTAIAGGYAAGIWQVLQAGDPKGLAVLAAVLPLMLVMMVMVSTLRVTVTRDQVAVQYGPIGPQIPIDSIEHCEAEDYEFWKYGGYGVRYSPIEGAWCYNMLGDKGKAVRIHYRTKSGALRKVLVASPRHHVLADAINRARMARGHEVPPHLAPDDAELGVGDDEYVFSNQDDAVEREREEEQMNEEVASEVSSEPVVRGVK